MRKAIYIVASVIVVLAGGWFYANHTLRSNLTKLINSNPDRAYNFEFRSLTLNLISREIILKNVDIKPLTDTIGTIVTAQVAIAELKNVDLASLLAGRNLVIEKLSFLEPKFDLDIRSKPDTGEIKSKGEMQKLFGDILSRGKISEFRIRNGSMRATKAEFGKEEFLLIKNYNLIANDIITDSVQWNHQVPFKMGSFSTSMDSVVFRIDTNTVATTGLISYNTAENEFLICNAAILNERDLKIMSIANKVQKDIIEISFDTLSISGIKTGNGFYGDITIMASKLVVTGLEFTDFRNKNLPRPADKIKPMFSGIIRSIPFSFQIDTIMVRDAIVQYTELERGRSRPGSVTLSDIDMRITDLTSMIDAEKESFRIDLTCLLNGSGRLQTGITVPYKNDRFIMNMVMRGFDARSLTSTTEPILGVDIASGKITHLNFTMNANEVSSQNYLVLQYDDLKIVLNDPEMYKTHQGFISHIANSAIRTSNLPEDRSYITASYSTMRNQNRGPFNFIWNSLREGILKIIPSGSARMIMDLEEGRKNKRRKSKK